MARVGSGHKGLTPERVVDAATDLTREVGLDGWSIRDLSARLGVAPSSIYHHVGDRAAVVRRVIGGLTVQFPLVDPDLDWRVWFEETLLGVRDTLRGYPGVARWFMMRGPALPETAPIADAGMAALARAGFGDRAGFAYAVMFNQVVGSVAFGDDRDSGGSDADPHDRAALLAGLDAQAQSSPGVATLVRTLVHPFATDPVAEGRFTRDALRVTMRGLAAELAEATQATSSGEAEGERRT